MNKYVAFLRAVNVGGRTIKMNKLAAIFESLKFKDVKTFIQSGNVLFGTAGKNRDTLSSKIEKKLNELLGYEVKTILRTPGEINELVEGNPFANELKNEDIRVYVAFLSEVAGNEHKKILASLNNKNESYVLSNSNVYCLIHKDKKTGGYFAVIQLEKMLGIPLTIRNITTVTKINELFKKS